MQPDGANEILDRLVHQGISQDKIQVQYGDSLLVGAYMFGEPTNQPLLLIHGSPGDWSAWENIIANDSINNNYYIVAVDRVGYGLTTVPAESRLKIQAEALWVLIDSLKLHDITVVGHSYGGAVVEQLLVDHQEVFKMALLVAPTISPKHMSPRWYNKLADNKFVDKLLPEDLRTSNIEMMGLPESLKKLEIEIPKINVPIIFMQGTDDVLVPFESVDYFKVIAPVSVEYIILDKMNHFIPWTNPDLINEILLKNIAK